MPRILNHLPPNFKAVDPNDYADQLRMQLAHAETSLQTMEQRNATHYHDLVPKLDRTIAELMDHYAIGDHLERVNGSKAWQSAMDAVRPLVTAFLTSIPLRIKLYIQLDAIAQRTSSLSTIEKHHLSLLKRAFELGGAQLESKARKRYSEIIAELSALTECFTRNLRAATASIEVSVKAHETAGVPKALLQEAKARSVDKGQCRIRLDGRVHTVADLLRLAEHPALRRKLWLTYHTRAAETPFDNFRVIMAILERRQEQARLLGYDSFLELKRVGQMLSTAPAAQRFLDHIANTYVSEAQAEHDALSHFVRETENRDPTSVLNPWDRAFYEEKRRSAVYESDDASFRAYSALDSVLDRLFRLLSKVFDIHIKRTSNQGVWDESVQVYQVEYEGENMGRLYLDLLTRSGKRLGSWTSVFTQANSRQSPPIICLVTNFKTHHSKDSLMLSHAEMLSLFHEFGHVLHHLFSHQSLPSLTNVNLPRDFLELPALFMEKWLWHPTSLAFILRHHKTQTPPSNAFIEKWLRVRNDRSATRHLYQIALATLDLELHRLADIKLVRETDFKIAQRFSTTKTPTRANLATSFEHIFGNPSGYAANYYAYVWCDALAREVFESFERHGLFSKEVGKKFRETILAVGDTISAMDAVGAFLGCDQSEILDLIDGYL